MCALRILRHPTKISPPIPVVPILETSRRVEGIIGHTANILHACVGSPSCCRGAELNYCQRILSLKYPVTVPGHTPTWVLSTLPNTDSSTRTRTGFCTLHFMSHDRSSCCILVPERRRASHNPDHFNPVAVTFLHLAVGPGSHWETRLMATDIMAPVSTPGAARVSPLTLAAFEDSGTRV
jgi:hypothetical protein